MTFIAHYFLLFYMSTFRPDCCLVLLVILLKMSLKRVYMNTNNLIWVIRII